MKYSSQIPLAGQNKQSGAWLGALSESSIANVHSLPWPAGISEGLSPPRQPKWAPRSSRGERGDGRKMDGIRGEGRDKGKRERQRGYMRPHWLHNMSVWCFVDSLLGAFVSRGSIVWGSEQLSGYEESMHTADRQTDRQTVTCRHRELFNPSPLSWTKQSKIRDREEQIVCQSRLDSRKTKFSVLLSLFVLCCLFD